MQHRVLLVDNSYTFGGAIQCLSMIARELDRTRFQPVVASAQPDHVLRELFPHTAYHRLRPNAPWQRAVSARTGSGNRWLGRAHAVTWLLRRDLPEAVQLARIGRRHKVSVVHVNNNFTSQLAALLAARILRVPCIAHARSEQSARRSVRYYLPLVSRHIAISNYIEHNLVQIGADPARIHMIHDGISIQDFDGSFDIGAVRRELGIQPEDRVISWFGRIVDWKGTREFVEAAAQVVRAEPHTRALIVGDESDGSAEYTASVRRMAESLEVADRVIFAGYRKDIPALMHASDVIVHTSITPEPFGLVVVEAMAAGKPVVAAAQGGPLDIVVPGETGWLVDATRPVEIARAVLELLRDAPTRERMGESGRQRARALFSAQRNTQEIERLYSDLLTSTHP